jgi:wobble nucleotide-excising tRNase
MNSTLSAYGVEINKHLRALGAEFQVKGFASNYQGGTPRSTYTVEVRKHKIGITGKASRFATTLSEGDKRTMGFAFFAASVLADPDLSSKVIVVDDPMSSLDRSRRRSTVNLLVQIGLRAEQLVVLAHDPVFLRDLRDVWIKEKNHKPVAALRIVGAVGGVSDLGAMDLDRECESPFFTDYRLVSDYVAGSVQEHEKVAVALRLVLEGHLHRRFPGHIEQGVMLGSVITEIEKASASSPLRHAQRLVDELRVLNNYASPFHHHTGPDRSTRQPVDPGELRAYARRVLDIVHGAEDDSVA